MALSANSSRLRGRGKVTSRILPTVAAGPLVIDIEHCRFATAGVADKGYELAFLWVNRAPVDVEPKH